METWADDSSIHFPWGNLLQKSMVRKQRMGLSSGRGLLLRKEVICRTFRELMEWSEDKRWPKLRNLSTQSFFPLNTFAEFWKWMKWEAKKKKKEKKAELKKQRLVLKSSWENKPGNQTRCPIGNYMRLHSRGVDIQRLTEPYLKKLQFSLKAKLRWSTLTFCPAKNKKKANCF